MSQAATKPYISADPFGISDRVQQALINAGVSSPVRFGNRYGNNYGDYGSYGNYKYTAYTSPNTVISDANGLTGIGSSVYASSPGLDSVAIGGTVTAIGGMAAKGSDVYVDTTKNAIGFTSP